jgi:dTDP-L-rhamnose 4-epimerase
VSEIQVTYLPRIGKSKVTGTVRGCLRTVQDMSEVLAR